MIRDLQSHASSTSREPQATPARTPPNGQLSGAAVTQQALLAQQALRPTVAQQQAFEQQAQILHQARMQHNHHHHTRAHTQVPIFSAAARPQTPLPTPQGPFVPPSVQEHGPQPGAPNFPQMMPRFPDFNNLLQQHMAALQRYQAPPGPPTGTPRGQVPGTPQQSEAAPQATQPTAVQSGLREYERHLMQMNDETRRRLAEPSPNGVPTPPSNAEGVPSNIQAPPEQGPPRPQSGQQGFTQRTVGPNGETMTFSIQASTGPVPFPSFAGPFPPPQQANLLNNPGSLHPGFIPNLTPGGPQNPNGTIQGWSGSPPLGTFAGYYGAVHAVASMRRYHEDLSDLSQRASQQISQSNGPQPGVATGMLAQLHNLIRSRNRGQEMINNALAQNGTSTRDSIASVDVATLQTLNERFHYHSRVVLHLINRLRDGSPSTELSNNGASSSPSIHRRIADNGRPCAATPHPSTSNDITAYLLASPTGPQAVVFTPSGTFASPADPAPAFLRVPSRSRSQHRAGPTPRINELFQQARHELAVARDIVEAAVPPTPNARPDGEVANRPPVTDLVAVQRRPDAPQAAGAAPAAVGPQAAENGDGEGIMGPLLRHVWLLIRLFGFIWFFTGGLGSSRTFLIAGAATVWFAIQAGLLGDRIDRLRQHFEGLLGPPAGAVAGQDNAHQAQAAALHDQRRGEEPLDPQQTATRLLRQQRDRGWLRQTFRTIEGAVALFIASLYPGVGERHVAAREEQRRQAEARAAEVLRVSEEEAARADQPEEGVQPTDSNADAAESSTEVEKDRVRAPAEAETSGVSSANDAGEGSSTSVLRNRRTGEESM